MPLFQVLRALMQLRAWRSAPSDPSEEPTRQRIEGWSRGKSDAQRQTLVSLQFGMRLFVSLVLQVPVAKLIALVQVHAP